MTFPPRTFRRRARDHHNEVKRAELKIPCDGCHAVFVGTRRDARAAGWVTRWRQAGRLVQQQVDLCPGCRGCSLGSV